MLVIAEPLQVYLQVYDWLVLIQPFLNSDLEALRKRDHQQVTGLQSAL